MHHRCLQSSIFPPYSGRVDDSSPLNKAARQATREAFGLSSGAARGRFGQLREILSEVSGHTLWLYEGAAEMPLD
jgi:hypothetical protein